MPKSKYFYTSIFVLFFFWSEIRGDLPVQVDLKLLLVLDHLSSLAFEVTATIGISTTLSSNYFLMCDIFQVNFPQN